MKKILLVLMIMLTGIVSCNKNNVKETPANWGKVYMIEKIQRYGIVMEDGRRFLPVNLDIRFQVDSLPVLFDYVPAEESVPSGWGVAIRITRMQME